MGPQSDWQPQSPGRRAEGQPRDPATLAQRTRPALGQLEQRTLPWGLLGDVVPSRLTYPARLSTLALLPRARGAHGRRWVRTGESWGHPLRLAAAYEQQRQRLPRTLSGVGLAGGWGSHTVCGGVPALLMVWWSLSWSRAVPTPTLGKKHAVERSKVWVAALLGMSHPQRDVGGW